jgi:hypothetical protein
VRSFGAEEPLFTEAALAEREMGEPGLARESSCPLISLVYRTDRLALVSELNVLLPGSLSAIEHSRQGSPLRLPFCYRKVKGLLRNLIFMPVRHYHQHERPQAP